MTYKNIFIFSGLFFIFADCVFATNSYLRPMKFQQTASDATFKERTENASQGYAPYVNKSAFTQITVESEEAYINRMIDLAEHQRQTDLTTMSLDEYCKKYSDSERCPHETIEELTAIDKRPQQQTRTPTTHTSIQNFVGYSEFDTPVTLDLRIHGAHCTMPQHSDIFTNKILTTGNYRISDPAFEKAMITTFRAEGGCVNDPNDSGGYTCYGISQNNNPDIDVKNITRADAENIAYNKYYKQYGIHLLPDHIRGDVFMMSWGAGPVTAIRRFCKFLGIAARNTIDAEVVAAAENYNGDLHNDFLDNQKEFYVDISKINNNHIYLKGWMNRLRLKRENGCHSETTNPIRRN